MNRKTIYSATVFIVLLFTACDMADSEDGRVSASGEKAAVQVVIGTASSQSRTVAPGVELEGTDWRLLGGKQEDTETLLAEFSDDGDKTVYLVPGIWSFTLEGYQDNALVLRGSIAEQTINPDPPNTLEFTVAPVLDEAGTVSIIIELPDDSGITDARIFRNGTELTPSVAPLDNRIVLEYPAHPAGNYYFSVRLYRDADLYGVVSEMVQVRANLESAKTYTLTWEDLNRIYVITYHLGEEETETDYFRHTDADITLDEPSRDRHDFEGWYENADLSGEAVTQIPAGSMEDKDFYAKWTRIQYTVTFDADGGSPATQTKTVNSDEPFGSENMPTEPSMSGYAFGGWYTQQYGDGTHFTVDTPVTAEITIYAKWIPQYTVTFNADGGTPETQIRIVNSSSSIGAENMPEDPMKDENNFNGWYTKQNGGGFPFYATTAITGDITLYAKWTLVQYTVTFDADGGSPATQTKTVDSGYSVGSENLPSEPEKRGYSFDGWYTESNGGGAPFTGDEVISGHTTVYAQWLFIPLPDDLSLANALSWLDTNAGDEGVYTITLSGPETIGPKTLSYNGMTVSITLSGDTEEQTVSLGSNGALFTVGDGVTLTLGSNVTLQGRSGNPASLVRVNSGGTLVMESDSKISGNKTSATYDGGGVFVHSGAFMMNGGEISDNTAYGGGGVIVYDGTFTMSGGTISGNTASSGGGVYIYTNGTFTMSGGTINGNSSSSRYGGGVTLDYDGTFTMSGGTISGNTSIRGGGVYVYGGTFTKQSSGIIYGSNALDSALNNTASSGDDYGHAVYVDGSPAKIRNSTAGTGVTLNNETAANWE